MKKVILILMAVFLFVFFVPTQLRADEEPGKTTTTVSNTVASTKINALTERLDEIMAMDIPALSPSEKKELRKEVRLINRELKTIAKSDSKTTAVSNSEANDNGGIYLSAGAVIVIILLIIILL